MTTRKILSYGLSALVLGGTVAGAATGSAMLASAAKPLQTADDRRAANEAREAREDLARGRAAGAVPHAEAAVAAAPRVAEYRALLGQAYLMSGRFTSAGQALADALGLDPSQDRVALNLALAQVALGDWSGARTTLEAHAHNIADSDRGLAIALAGDPATAVDILTAAARGPEANGKTRQNLALSLALAGRWNEAKSVAAIDVPADQLDQRIMDWAAFARPANAYDQVASLLGVQPVADEGQPIAIALANSSAPVMAARSDAPADAAVAAPAAQTEAPLEEYRVTTSAPDASLMAAAASSGVVFAPRSEVVQALPEAPIAARPAVASVARAPRVSAPASGDYYVQLGAFRTSGAARTAWSRATARFAALGGMTPSAMEVSTRNGTFHRLSVGGYSRSAASALCGEIKSSGGVCFVRRAAGDQVAQWVREDAQIASR